MKNFLIGFLGGVVLTVGYMSWSMLVVPDYWKKLTKIIEKQNC